jgi:D-inositol-3-phosphate glycosyltransferase
MKVALVSEHASPLAALGGEDAGGQNVHVAALARELAARRIDVTVYTRRDDSDLPARVPIFPGAVVEHVEAGPARPISKDHLLPYMDRFAEGLFAAWRASSPDVVHSHFWMSGRAALDAAAPLKIPLVHTFHALGVVKKRYQGPRDTSPPQRLLEERAIIATADRIIATCTDEVFELIRLGADGSRLSVVPCGVDTQLFRPEGPVEPRRPGVPRLGIVTRLVERKGVGDVLAALPALPGVELVVAGGGEAKRISQDPEAARLTALAEALGVRNRVKLLGRVAREQVPPLLRSANVVVCAPWYEPFGIVPLEAMACARPVVASAVGGLIDTVVDGITGIHVPPRRPDKLAEALRLLLADEAMRGRLGAAGAERARSRYTWARVADATIDVYLELLAKPAFEREEAIR